MCIKSTLRIVCCGIGIPTQIFFFIMSFFFWWPAMWYLDLTNINGLEYIGGVLSYCTKGLLFDWKCDDVDQDIAEGWGHEWGAYQTIKAFVPITYLIAVAVMVLFYVQICIKSKIISAVCAGLAIGEFVLILIASSLASSTFSEVGQYETDAAYSLFCVWLAWIATIVNMALAIVACIAVFLDD
ncbi:uncharacterized protein LOC142338455 [Convolutriloba macropyga]|uniref:uncharacterized protein LOC142338455 n=1 Tax=Convolutriloba macropyga TaxID=536237 RepID=UPI003F5256FA